jgi:hypothetical protein
VAMSLALMPMAPAYPVDVRAWQCRLSLPPVRLYEKQLWRSRHGLSQADGHEAGAHLTCSLNQLLNSENY